MRITAVVLNWRRPDETIACVQSILDTAPEVGVIVIDNASRDGSIEKIRSVFPSLTLIENPVNAGYAGGNNIGIARALRSDAEAIFVLNNDVTLQPGCVQRLTRYMNESNFDLIGPLSLLRSDHAIVDFYSARVDLHNVALHADFRDTREFPQDPMETDYVTGSAIMMRAEAVRRRGMFDERFFLVWEDVDLALRFMCNAGVLPDARVFHGRSVSFGGEGSATYQYFYVRNSFLIVEKHVPWWRRRRTRALLDRRYRGWMEKPETTPEIRAAIGLGLEHGLAGRWGPPPTDLIS